MGADLINITVVRDTTVETLLHQYLACGKRYAGFVSSSGSGGTLGPVTI